jgi:hypothetical protein
MPFGPTVDGYREVLATIKEQENLFGPARAPGCASPRST